MLNTFPAALAVGTVLGFFSGLGVGGGSLLILWLTIVLQMEQPEARTLNLLFFLPAAAVSCLFRWKQGCLPLKTIAPAVLAGIAGAAVFSQVGKTLDIAIAKKAFGLLLLLAGIREIRLGWKKNSGQ